MGYEMSIASAITGFADEISPDLDEQLDLLVKLKFDGLDLRSAFGKNVSELSGGELDDVRTRTEAAGLRVHAIGSPVNKVPMSVEHEAEQMRKLDRCIEAAIRCGTKRVRIFTPETDDWAGVRAWVRPQVRLAEQAGILLLHENDGRYFGAFPSRAQLLFKEFAGAHFKAVFDFANTVLLGCRPMKDWFPWLLPYLDTLHIKDAIEAEGRIVSAGEGDGEMLETLRFLKGEGWSGPLTLEPHASIAGPAGGFSGAESFTAAAEALRGVLAQAEG